MLNKKSLACGPARKTRKLCGAGVTPGGAVSSVDPSGSVDPSPRNPPEPREREPEPREREPEPREAVRIRTVVAEAQNCLGRPVEAESRLTRENLMNHGQISRGHRNASCRSARCRARHAFAVSPHQPAVFFGRVASWHAGESSTQAASRHASRKARRRKGLALTACLSILLSMANFFVTPAMPQAHAEFAESGQSPYRGMIDWVDWDSAVDGIKNEGGTTIPASAFPLKQESRTQIGDGVLVTTCVVNGGYADRATWRSNSIEAYRPGWNYNGVPRPNDRGYQGDAFDHFYGKERVTDNGIVDNRGLAAGIGGNAGYRRFDISCSTRMERPGMAPVEVPIKGMVFANAETIDNVEAIGIVPAVQPGKDLSWRLLESSNMCSASNRQYVHRGNLYSDVFDMYSGALSSPVDNNGGLHPNAKRNRRFYYSEQNIITKKPATPPIPNVTPEFSNSLRTDDAVMLSSPNENCWVQRNRSNYNAGNSINPRNTFDYRDETGHNRPESDFYGPFTTLYADNAYGAEVMFQNNGGNDIAIGVVLGLDMGDAPQSYSNAAALNQPDITGGEIPWGEVHDALELEKARLAPVAEPRFGDNVDIDTADYAHARGSWYTTRGDDDISSTGAVDDEDGITEPLLVYARPDTAYRKAVTCTGEDANVAAWLDWNGNGTFEEKEKTTTTCNGGEADLDWYVTGDMVDTSRPPGMYPSALRMIISTDAQPLRYNGMTRDGEVEDHAVTLVVPGVTVQKAIVDQNGKPVQAPPGTLADWQFTPTQNGPSLPAGDPEAGNIASAPQATNADGTITWPLQFKPGNPKNPIELGSTITGFVPADPITFTETQKPGFRFYDDGSGASCTAPTQPANERWQPGHHRDTYAWSDPQVSTQPAPNGFTLSGADPGTVLNCTVTNQPLGQISVKPSIDSSGLPPEQAGGFTPDPGLQFNGEYSCVPPEFDPAGQQPITGTWGPVAAGETWTSDPRKDRIPVGSTCTVTQTGVQSTTPDNSAAHPMAGSSKYRWDETQQPGPVVAANAQVSGDAVPVAEVKNPVSALAAADLIFRKTDAQQRPLGGAEFSLQGGPGPAGATDEVDLIITDATSAEEAADGPDVDATEGGFRVSGLPLGTYTLTETQAPGGFAKLKDPITFEITDADVDAGKNLGDVVNERVSASGLPGLPITGGTAASLFILGGVAIVALAGIAGLVALRRRQAGAQ
ncbi:LPXTG-motif cell wall anchor domain-containing protein [Actinobaculum suis]|uniref:LPXTG-motif cell wall anchor domain-containing protein n=2 Tax=Actinobaculum suis TaxID=1657 RepID=A0A1G6ZJL4_9ACTO|nr:LPXTG-motif cell wall anchor domain-containing protein [Actinobaculum suis]